MQTQGSWRAGGYPAPLLVGFWFSVAIALAAVVRRLAQILRPSNASASGMASLDAAFSSHAQLTLLHIVPAGLFVLVATAVLLGKTQRKWLEGLFFALGGITGVTAYAMSLYAVGGWIERSAVLVFDSWFLVSLGNAFWFWRRGEAGRKRTWMVRAVGVLLGIATTRPVMVVFFATSSVTHLALTQFFGMAFWIGFGINVVATELWLHSRRRGQRVPTFSSLPSGFSRSASHLR